MKEQEATEKICPYINSNCITEKCMFWETTINGKKELDRKIEPYDMTPMDIRQWADNLKSNGYINIGKEKGFRDYHAKYEHSFEGLCKIRENKKEEN